MNEMNWYEMWKRPKGRVPATLLQNFVKDINESWHNFHSFCMDESEKNEAKGLERALFPTNHPN